MHPETEKRPHCKAHHTGGGGPTSYDMHDSERIFSILQLQADDIFVDIGCGRGDYSMRAAKEISTNGRIIAIDSWSTCPEYVGERAREQGLSQIITLTTDIRTGLPLPDASATICLFATILHATTLNILQEGLGKELQRILQPGGRVAVVEMKKEDQPFGPPPERRLEPEQVITAFSSYGFSPLSFTDLGFTYLLLLQKQECD